MDSALTFGNIPATLPFIKKEAVQLLKAKYSTTTDATERLPSALVSFYQQSYPDLYSKRQEDIHQAGRAVLAIYQRNVFPELQVSWGTYPNNLGHTDFPGCFRCHDGSHVATDGTAISQDCSSCHEPLAMDETSPEILKTLGIAQRIKTLQKP
jgi:formate-dependent nitrite reductase cytochrome c552 subunit